MHDLTQLGETDASFAWLLLGVQDGQYVRCIFACHVPSFGRCNPQQFLRIHAAHMAILDGVKETPQIAKREEILEKQLEFLQALSNRSWPNKTTHTHKEEDEAKDNDDKKAKKKQQCRKEYATTRQKTSPDKAIKSTTIAKQSQDHLDTMTRHWRKTNA
jgi:hypothetical protein